jgi:malate dehydrogenase
MIPAGVPRKPGMTRDDLFNINASIVKNLSAACAKYKLHNHYPIYLILRYCPDAHILVISNPVNSTVPIAYETLKANGIENPSVFGVTALDTVRAKTFVGELKNLDPAKVDIKVVGGHSGPTIVPILSSVNGAQFTEEEAKSLVQRIQYGGDEVVKAKAGAGSATLSMAFAAKEFYRTIVAHLDGASTEDLTVRPIAFVKTDAFETGYFASELTLGVRSSFSF